MLMGKEGEQRGEDEESWKVHQKNVKHTAGNQNREYMTWPRDKRAIERKGMAITCRSP